MNAKPIHPIEELKALPTWVFNQEKKSVPTAMVF